MNFGYEFELYSDFGDYRVRGIDMLEKQVNEFTPSRGWRKSVRQTHLLSPFQALKNPLVRTWTVTRKQYQRWRESQAELFGISGQVL